MTTSEWESVPRNWTATLMLLGGLRAVIRFGDRPRPADVAGRVVSAIVGPAWNGAAR